MYVLFGPHDGLQKGNTALHIAAVKTRYTALRQLVQQPGVQLDARNAVGGMAAWALYFDGQSCAVVGCCYYQHGPCASMHST